MAVVSSTCVSNHSNMFALAFGSNFDFVFVNTLAFELKSNGQTSKKHHKHKKLKLELLLSTDSSTSSSDDDEWEATAGQLALALAAAVGGETMAAMLGILPNQAGEPSQPSRLFFFYFLFFLHELRMFVSFHA